MLPATSSGEAARAVLLDAASREPRVPHSELRRMLRNTSITSPADVRLRSDYIDAAGKRLGRALHKVYGNSTLGLWKLLHALAEEHDDLTGGTPPPPSAASWWADQRGRRRPPSAAGALQPQGAPRPPLAGASLSALVRRAADASPDAVELRRVWSVPRGVVNATATANATANISLAPFSNRSLLPPTACRGLLASALDAGRSALAPAGRPGTPKPEGFFDILGRLCFDGLEETAKSFMAQSAQEQDRQNKKNAGEVDALAKGLPEPCPESNPIARDMNQQYVNMANAMSPHTAEETNVLYKFWAQGGCPGVSTWSPIPGQWYKAAGTFGTFYGGLLGGSVADPFGRQYGHNELRESPHCFTLLETYLRFCTAPPRALQLGQTVRRAANATAAADAAAIELDRLTNMGDAAAAAEGGGGAAAAGPWEAAAAAAGGDARRGGAVAVRGGRPIGAHGGRPFIDDIIKQIENFIKSLLTIIINLIKRLAAALAPVIVSLLLAPMWSILQVLPWLIAQRVIPALLGAPVYPPRPGGFTGPDPYDPYGPDSPEPRPFQNPGAEMCHSLLETYTGNCAFPARSGNV